MSGGIAWGNAPGGSADPVLGKVGPLALDSSYRLRAVVERLSGSTDVSADNIASPTDAAAVAAFSLGYDGATWDRLRVRAWPTASGTETASAAALDVTAALVGYNGSGGISRARVLTTGAQVIASAVGDIDASANNTASNYGSTALLNTYAVALMGVTSSLDVVAAGAHTKRGVLGDTYGQLYTQPGAPAPNARDNGSIGFVVDTASVNLKASAGSIWSVYARSREGAATTRYFQIHNKASAPAAADVPILSYRVESGEILKLAPNELGGPHGRYLPTGISVAWSSAVASYTVPGSNLNEMMIIYY